MPVKVAFDVPYLHIAEFEDWQDFHVARYEPAIADSKYREKLKPISLLVCPALELRELARVVSLVRPQYATVHVPDNVQDADARLKEASVLLDCELAVVVQPGSPVKWWQLVGPNDMIYLPPWEGRLDWPGRLDWLATATGDWPWIHVEEIRDPQELRGLVGLSHLCVSVHTAKPVKMAVHGCDDWLAVESLPDVDPATRLTPEQLARARTIAEAIWTVTR